MNARELLTKWGFQIEHEKLSKVENQLEGIKRRLEFLGAVEVTRALAGLAEKFASFGEELHIAASSAGLTVEEFQKLAFSAKQNSVSQEEMEHSLFRLSRTLYAARTGSAEAQRSFALLGFSGDQVNAFKTSKDVMLAIADRFRNMKDPIEKAALATQIMGRGSLHMVGWLSQGSAAVRAQGAEFEKLGGVLKSYQVEGLVKLEHALQKIWGLFKSLSASIASEVAPVFEYLINDFIKLLGINRNFIEGNFEDWFIHLAGALGFVWGVLKGLIIRFKEFSEAMKIDKNLGAIVFEMGKLAGVVFGISKSFQIIGGVWTFLNASALPYYLTLLAIAAALHEIWAITSGRMEETYLMRSGAIPTREKFQADHPEWFQKGGAAKTPQTAEETAGLFKNISDFFSFPQGTYAPTAAPGAGNISYSMNAPISVVVPPGTPPNEVAGSLQEAVREHMDRVFRETQRSLVPAVAR